MKIHDNYSPEGLKYKRSEDATFSWGLFQEGRKQAAESAINVVANIGGDVIESKAIEKSE